MARIPLSRQPGLGSFQNTPTATPARVDFTGVGAGVKALTNFGATIQSEGDKLAAIGQAQAIQRNRHEVQARGVAFRQFLSDQKNEYSKLQGQDAVDHRKTYAENVTAEKRRVLSQVSDPNVRAALENSMAQSSLAAGNAFNTYSNGQQQIASQATDVADMQMTSSEVTDKLLSEGASTPGSVKAQEEASQHILDLAISMADRHGLKDKARDAFIHNTASSFHKGVINSLISEQRISDARAYMAKFSDLLLPRDRVALDKSLRTSTDAADVESITQAIIGARPGDRKAQEVALLGSGLDPRLMKEARAVLDNNATRERRQRSEHLAATLGDATKAVIGGASIQTWVSGNPVLASELKSNPIAWRSLLATEKNIAEGSQHAATSDGKTLNSFKNLPVVKQASADIQEIKPLMTDSEFKVAEKIQKQAKKGDTTTLTFFDRFSKDFLPQDWFTKGNTDGAASINSARSDLIAFSVDFQASNGRFPNQQELTKELQNMGIQFTTDPGFFSFNKRGVGSEAFDTLTPEQKSQTTIDFGSITPDTLATISQIEAKTGAKFTNEEKGALAAAIRSGTGGRARALGIINAARPGSLGGSSGSDTLGTTFSSGDGAGPVKGKFPSQPTITPADITGDVILPLKTGKDTARKAVNIVNGILPGAGIILGEIAKVESNFGGAKDTFRSKNSKAGQGIWQLDRGVLKSIQTNKRAKSFFSRIKQATGIDFASVSREDLKKPLYGALAARLLLLTITAPIPKTAEGRAEYWKKYYNKGGKGTIDKYLSDVKGLL